MGPVLYMRCTCTLYKHKPPRQTDVAQLLTVRRHRDTFTRIATLCLVSRAKEGGTGTREAAQDLHSHSATPTRNYDDVTDGLRAR